MEPTLAPKLAPYVVARDAPALIRFIEKGIGGRLSFEVKDSEGSIRHAEVRIADAFIMIGEAPAGRPPFPAMLHLYVEDAGTACRNAVAAGATSVREPVDSDDGLRRGGVRDAWGNEWWFSSPAKGQ
jgi:PhnB protein